MKQEIKQSSTDENKKKQTVLWIVFAVAVLILIGLGAYWYITNLAETTEENAGQQQEDQNDDGQTALHNYEATLKCHNPYYQEGDDFPENTTHFVTFSSEEELTLVTDDCSLSIHRG